MNQSIALISALTISLFSIGCASEFETVCNEDSKAQKCRGDDGCSGLQVCSGGYWLACECSGGVDSSEMLSSSEENPENPISSSDKEGTGGSSNTVNGGVNSDATGGTGGTGGTDNSACIPETCEEVGERISGMSGHSACGDVTDQCGNVLRCQPTSCDARQDCGGTIWNYEVMGNLTAQALYATSGITELYDRFENKYKDVCGESCIDISAQINHQTVCSDTYKNVVMCADNTSPQDDCEYVEDSVWCCLTTGKYSSY